MTPYNYTICLYYITKRFTEGNTVRTLDKQVMGRDVGPHTHTRTRIHTHTPAVTWTVLCSRTVREVTTRHTMLMTNSVGAEDRGDKDRGDEDRGDVVQGVVFASVLQHYLNYELHDDELLMSHAAVEATHWLWGSDVTLTNIYGSNDSNYWYSYELC